MSELKSCPFCGADDVKIWTEDRDVTVICLECEAAGPNARDEHDAAMFWNSRNSGSTRLGNYVKQ